MPISRFSDEEKERIKREAIDLLRQGHSVSSACKALEITHNELRDLRNEDQKFDLESRDARWVRTTNVSIIKEMYGDECLEGHLNAFLVEYHKSKSLPKAINNSTLTPITFKRLTDPEGEFYHPEFANLVREIEQMHLLEMDDELRQKALKGDAAAQKWILERLDPKYRRKESEGDPSVYIFTSEKLSSASHTLVSLARQAQGARDPSVPRQSNGRQEADAPSAGFLPRGESAPEDP